MPATLFCVLFYSAGVPKAQRFSVPWEPRCSQRVHHWQVVDRMTALAVVVNELSLPVDLLMMPCFMTVGQKAALTLEDAPCERHTSAWADIRCLCAPFWHVVCVSLRCLETLEDLQVRPMEVLQSCSTAVGLGIAAWALATPMVLGAVTRELVPKEAMRSNPCPGCLAGETLEKEACGKRPRPQHGTSLYREFVSVLDQLCRRAQVCKSCH